MSSTVPVAAPAPGPVPAPLRAPFALCTLGYPCLESAGGEQVRFRTRKHFAVLIRLALAAGHRCSREELMEMLWPGVSAKLARHSLAQAITVIKSKLGREYVLALRNAVALTAGAVDVDALRMDGPAPGIAGSFLEGFDIPGARGFDQWKDEWTAKLLPKIRDCLVRQMDGGRRLGDFARVEHHANVLLQFDPLSEDGVRGVMEGRAWVGDRTTALKAYDAYVAQLAEGLGARPSPEVVRMAGLLREGRAPLGGARAVSEPSGRRERRMEAERLVGRSREFSQLYDTWREARTGSPRVVVVTGDPGIGKTTLTNTFLSSCQLEGAIVARVQAYDAERELPFAVLSELVRQLALQRTIGAADPGALAELSRVCPDVGVAFPGVPKAPDWSADVVPLRLADALLKSISAAAEESPVVLVVDDIHAADNASTAILHMLARKMVKGRFLLMLAGRPAELRVGGAGVLVGDSSIGGMATVDLEPLSEEAARELVQRLGGPQDPPVDRILQAGRGNALALELLTREWVDHGPDSLLRDLEAINTTPAPRIGIPQAVRNVFDRESRRLDAGVRSVLDFAAVLGRRLHEVELYGAAGLTPMAAASALARLMDEGFLRDVQGVVEFRNELIRAQAYYAIPGAGREHLHRAAGEALSGLSPGRRVGAELEIAWHFIRGRSLERALEYALDGAERCLERGAPNEAEQVLMACAAADTSAGPRLMILLAQALLDQSRAEDASPYLEVLSAKDGITATNKAQIAAMRASAEYMLAREVGNKHLESASEAFEAADSAGDFRNASWSLYLLARTHGEMGDVEGLRRVRERIGELRVRPGYANQPMIHFVEGYCEFMDGSAEVAASHLRVADALVVEGDWPVEQLPILNGAAICKLHSGDASGACDVYERAYALATVRGNHGWACWLTANLCSVLSQMGETPSAVRYGEVSVVLAEKVLRQPRAAMSYTNLASAYLLSGELSRASTAMDRAASIVSNLSHWEPRVVLYQESACIALSLGRTEDALQHIARLDEILGSNAMPPNAGVCERLRALRAFYTQGQDVAFALARRALDRFRHKNAVYYLDALSALAFLERMTTGAYSAETGKALELFETLGLRGKRRHLTLQGFLA